MGGGGKESVMAEPPRARFRLLLALSACVKRFYTLPGSRPSRKVCCIQRLLWVFSVLLGFLHFVLFCFRDHTESCCGHQKGSGDAHGMASCRMTPRELGIGAVRHTALPTAVTFPTLFKTLYPVSRAAGMHHAAIVQTNKTLVRAWKQFEKKGSCLIKMNQCGLCHPLLSLADVLLFLPWWKCPHLYWVIMEPQVPWKAAVILNTRLFFFHSNSSKLKWLQWLPY